MELNDVQRLALATALERRLKDITNPHGGRNGAPTLRTEVDDEMRRLYEDSGVDRKRIPVGDRNVGTISLRFSKPRTEHSVYVDDMDALVAWLREDEDGADALRALVAEAGPDALRRVVEGSGTVPDGCRVDTRDVPSTILGTTLRVDAEELARALGDELPGAMTALLTDGGGAE